MFAFSLVLNGFGNGLTVALNLGSALWTASAVNLSHTFTLRLSWVLLLEGVAVVIVNALILGQLDWRRILGNFLYMIPFSFLVSGWADLIRLTPVVTWPLAVRVVLDLLGVVCIGSAVSVYQRLNIMLHPNDDFMQIIRFRFLHGNAAAAQPASFIPPIMISTVCWAATGAIYAVNIGTLFSLLAQGAVVGLADRWLFPRLQHRHLRV
jgi:uncharacterized membrane protein YczE